MALRTLGAALLMLSTLVACSRNPERLPTPTRNFYYVMEDSAQQHEYLRLKESERKPFLEKAGLWQQWLELSEKEREAVDTGNIAVGYKEFAAHMAWGLPANVRSAESGGRVVRYETFIRCTSGPKIGKYVRTNIDCDGTSSEVEIALENGIVTEIKFLD
jgi:hypothetical protein